MVISTMAVLHELITFAPVAHDLSPGPDLQIHSARVSLADLLRWGILKINSNRF
jgi:hypothetical protein